MSSYYTHSDEDELDIRIHRGRSPSHHHVAAPVIYPEHRYRPAPRPYYAGETSYLVPAVTSGALHRSRSTGHRPSPPPPAPAQPIVINNRIYNEFEDDDYSLQPPRPLSHGRRRSGSRSRPSSYIEPERERERIIERTRRDPRDEYELEKARRDLDAYRLAHTRDEYEMEKARRDLEAYKIAHTRDEYEIERKRRELEEYRWQQEKEDYNLEKMRRELEKTKIGSAKEEAELEKAKKELKKFKDAQEREAEEKRIKKEMELARLIEEKKAEDEKKRLKKEADAAIEKYKIEEAKKKEKEKKEKEEGEKEYQKRLEEDLRKSGMDERQIAVVMKKDHGNGAAGTGDLARPTYTRMSRRHLSVETLNRYRIDYEFDQDPEYILIKRWVPEYEQDFLWSHTREIRQRREVELRRDVVLTIEGKKKPHHHHHGGMDVTEFELVKKTKHVRKPSPSPLLTFFAGGKPR